MKLLIPLSEINEECAVTLNIDERKQKANVEEAQEDLKGVLGAEFYEEIETQYSPTASTLTAANLTLYEDYIKKFLAWQAYFYSLGFSQSSSTPTGEREHLDENSTLIKDVALYSKEKNIRRRADKWKYSLITFLQQAQARDANAYPLWKDCPHESLSFAISSIEKNSWDDTMFSLHKATTRNE